MATNLVADGKVINYVAGATIAAGAVVVTGDIVGIALVGGVSGETIAVAIEGVFTVAKNTGVAWVQGDSLDWDAAGPDFDKDKAIPAAGDVENCAVAYAAAASAAATGQVKLTPGTGTAA